MLAKCYRNDTVSAAFEDSGAAHGVTTVSIRNLLRRRLWARPDDAATLVRLRLRLRFLTLTLPLTLTLTLTLTRWGSA